MSNEYSLADMAALTGGNDGFLGGGSGALIILFLIIAMMGGGGFGWGGNATGNALSQADLQRAIDLNSIQTGQAGISSDIQRGIYEINASTKDAAYNNLGEIRDVQAAAATGFANVQNSLTAMQANQQNCCCTTQRAIDSVNYNLASQSAAIQANDTANTQKVLDLINANRAADLQARVTQLETAAAIQNATAGVVKYPMATTYSSGANPFCGCGTNY